MHTYIHTQLHSHTCRIFCVCCAVFRGINLPPKSPDKPGVHYAKVMTFEGKYQTKFQTKGMKGPAPIWSEGLTL